MQISRRLKIAGMSLTELLVVLFILLVLSKVAISSYARLISRIRITTATSELHAALLYARSEAIKSGGNVIICRSISAHMKVPVCDAGISDPNSNSGWGDGWIIFHDRDGDGKLSELDTLLRVQEKLFQSFKEGAITPSPNRRQIKFNSLGQVYGNYIQFAIARSEEFKDPEAERYICLASGGRARVDKLVCNAK